MTDTELDMEKLRYQWLSGYDEEKEPDDEPAWSDDRGTYEADEDDEVGRWRGDTLTIFHEDKPDEYVKSDTYVDLEDNR